MPWSFEWHLVPAIFVDVRTVLCNLTAGLYAGPVGDATIGVTLYGTSQRAQSKFSLGPLYTFYDPHRGATVREEHCCSPRPRPRGSPQPSP